MAEHEARGETERVYHEILQVLRVSGVNLNFRSWAGFEKFLPAMWDALRPNLETRDFENAADEIRRDAVAGADSLPKLGAVSAVSLGESQRYQIQAALDLYHYINPKLLVLTSATRLALAGEEVGRADTAPPVRIQRGVPLRMYPMEMVEAKPDDERLSGVFDDIVDTLGLSSINSDYRTLALWPDYLEAAWGKLKPLVGEDAYREAGNALREKSRALARELPFPVDLHLERVAALGEDAVGVASMTQSFEDLLPSLILNIALLQLDWKSAETLRESPFPAPEVGR